ncbi:hypothetical protein BCS42_14335 [Crenothrix sp. D3]|nr:hypothetical protein BCS42_14335 [Crenothrix sp. D3]
MNKKLLIIPLLLGISTSSYSADEGGVPPVTDPSEIRPDGGLQQTQTVEQAINAAIEKAVAEGKDPVAAAAAATALAVKEAVAKNPTNPAAAAAAATAAAMKAVTSNSSITDKGAAASAIVQSAISAAPSYSADIKTAAVSAAPADLKNEITQAANYAVFSNNIQLADPNPTATTDANQAQLNIYVQEQTNIQTAVLNGDITVAQGFALQIQLSDTAPAGSGTKSPVVLQQEIIAAAKAGFITPAQGLTLEKELIATAPVNSGLVLSNSQ